MGVFGGSVGEFFTGATLIRLMREQRDREINDAVRGGLKRWRADNFIPPLVVVRWLEMGDHQNSALINSIRQVWREKHPA